MHFKRLCAIFAFVVLALTNSLNPVLAQSPDPSPSPSPTESPSPTPSPSPTATPSPSPTPDATASASPTTGGSVLGGATSLGETDSGKEFAKWFLIILGGVLTFVFALKVVRNDKEE